MVHSWYLKLTPGCQIKVLFCMTVDMQGQAQDNNVIKEIYFFLSPQRCKVSIGV